MKQEQKAKAKRYNFRLSNKLSGMLRAAVADKNAVEANPRYRLNMGVWHTPRKLTPRSKPICEVCMAGAVLAMRGNLTPDDSASAWGFAVACNVGDRTAAKMRAINWMRMGAMRSAAAEIELEVTDVAQLEALNMASKLVKGSYSFIVDLAPDATYIAAADILKAAGL